MDQEKDRQAQRVAGEEEKKKKEGVRRKEAARPLKEGLVTGAGEPCVTQI